MKKLLVGLVLVCILVSSYFLSLERLKPTLQELRQSRSDYINKCSEQNDVSISEKDFCDEIKKYKEEYISFGEAFTLINDYNPIFITPFVLIFTIVLLTSLNMCSFNKSKSIKNRITRLDYKTVIFKELLKSLTPGLIIAMAYTIRVLICYIYTKNISLDGLIEKGNYLHSNPLLYLLFYFLYSVLLGLVYSGVAIIISRFQKNTIITFLMACITIVGFELIFEIGVFNLIRMLFNSEIGVLFNIINYVNYNYSFGMLSPLLFATTIVILIMLYIYYIYHDCEKYIIDLEK